MKATPRAPAKLVLRRTLTTRNTNTPATLRGHRQEVKSVDQPAAPVTTAISTTASFTLLNGIQEGASFYNRIGRKIMMRSLHLYGNIQLSGNAGGTAEYARIMVVYDRQANTAFPAAQDLLDNYDNAGAQVTNSFASLNMNNAERFKVLRDIRIAVPTTTVATPAENAVEGVLDYTTNRCNINEFIRLSDLETHFKGTTNPAAIGDITTGSLLLFVQGQIAAAAAPYVLTWSARLRFHDT